MGGLADYYLAVKNADELIAAVKLARSRHWSYFILAGGSNVIFPERYRGLLIHWLPQTGQPKVLASRRVMCEAGLSLGKLIVFVNRRGLAGLETLADIPGTVGGAVVGNAGAYGRTVSEVVRRVEIFDGQRRRFIGARACRFAYRHSVFKERPWLVLQVEMEFAAGKPRTLAKRSREITILRRQRYLPTMRCPGSYFKNVLAKEASVATRRLIPPEKIIGGKIPAGYLLESVGALGRREGGVEVSDFHGNLFINRGNATIKDVKKLSGDLKRLVQQKFGIKLEEEVRYAG
mgnify:CR=1 FL=1